MTIQVDDINDHAPKFTQKLYQATMSENFPAGASVTSVSATDMDIGANAKMIYTLKEQDREFFSMTSVDATNTGVLKVFRVRALVVHYTNNLLGMRWPCIKKSIPKISPLWISITHHTWPNFDINT